MSVLVKIKRRFDTNIKDVRNGTMQALHIRIHSKLILVFSGNFLIKKMKQCPCVVGILEGPFEELFKDDRTCSVKEM